MASGLDVATQIAATVPALTLGVNCFHGPVREADADLAAPGAIPHEAVFCLGTGGLVDEPFQDGGLKTALKRPAVTIRIRSNLDDFDGGLSLANDVFDAIDKTPPTGYIEARAANSQPNYLRQDDVGHHEWTINVSLMITV